MMQRKQKEVVQVTAGAPYSNSTKYKQCDYISEWTSQGLKEFRETVKGPEDENQSVNKTIIQSKKNRLTL